MKKYVLIILLFTTMYFYSATRLVAQTVEVKTIAVEGFINQGDKTDDTAFCQGSCRLYFTQQSTIHC
jgi:hypothetical protein